MSVLCTHLLWFFSAQSRGRGALGETVLEAAWLELAVGDGSAAGPAISTGWGAGSAHARMCARLSVSERERACVHACTAPFICVWAYVRMCMYMRACGVKTLGAVGDGVGCHRDAVCRGFCAFPRKAGEWNLNRGSR